MIRKLMRRGINIVKYIICNSCIFVFFSTILYLIYRILDKAGAFSSIEIDIVPILKIEHYIVLVGCFCVLIIIFLLFETKIFYFDIFLKQYANVLLPMFYILQIVVWVKSENILLQLIYFVESLIIYLVGKYFVYKQQIYIMDRNNSAFSERPVIGRENLTKSQNSTLERLIRVIDDRKSIDSINIALLAAWGSGKSSVTDTLIDILQKRKGLEYKYFVLKINMLTMNKISNLVEYVGEYFNSLFKLYSITIFGRQENINFLSTISNLLDESKSTKFFRSFLNSKNRNGFIDLEYERRLFSNQISKLLKNSGRKNIILIIDDVDRSGVEDKMLQLLSEFSAVNGILCIVTLDAKKDIKFKPSFNNADNVEDLDIYNEVDKYIHLRLHIENENHIEYEEGIKKMLIDEYLQCAPKKNTLCFIYCSNMNKIPSISEPIEDYATQISANNERNQANLLSILFFENFILSDKTLGQYMEELITNYFSNCKEFYQDVVKMLTTDSKKWDKQLEHMYMTWFGYKRFQDDEFDWLNNLYNRAFQCLWTICDLNNGIELLCEKKNKIHFKDLHSIYAEYLNTKFLSRERYSEERVYSNFKFEIQLFMDDNLQSKLLNLINNNNYPECRRIMRISVEKIVYFCISVLTLNNFVFYLRNILNNYRTFKIQLREAKVLSLNYIDYLLSEWSTQKELTQQWDNMMERWPILKEIQVNWSSPRQFINKVVYNTYITGYGKKFKENFYGKIWIYGGRENKFLVISKKNEHIIMTIEGTRVNADTISLKEKEEIKQIGEKILGDF